MRHKEAHLASVVRHAVEPQGQDWNGGRDGGSSVTDRGGAMVVDRDVTLLKRWLDRWALSE